MNETELRIEYADRSLDFEYPDCIEEALEEDYVSNNNLYKEGIFEYIATYLLIYPDIPAETMLEEIRCYDKDKNA